MYIVFQVFVLLGTASLPLWQQFVARRFKLKTYKAMLWLPVLAGILFFMAGWLPDIHISRETNSFQEHFVGGGLYCAALFVYVRQLFGVRLHWLVELLALFAFTCTLGVANELLEFTVTKLNLTQINISDTSWDLVANTIGSFTGYVLLLPLRKASAGSTSKRSAHLLQ